MEFLDIANIHAVRNAHQRLREAAGKGGGEGLVSGDSGEWILLLITIYGHITLDSTPVGERGLWGVDPGVGYDFGGGAESRYIGVGEARVGAGSLQ